VVGNHRSYIDPALLMYQHILMPVAKAEVRRWPLIGRAAHASGVVFLERENKNSRKRVLTNIGKTIESGISVLLFPEGTTHRQPKTIDFRPASFNLAAELGIPVFPFALDFADPADYWLDADSFVPHFIRQLGKPRTTAFIHYGPAFTHTEGLELNRMVKNWIDDELGKIRSKINT
jgi:1-acyl-sn-glycerol-3-phosphate acyltransferase